VPSWTDAPPEKAEQVVKHPRRHVDGPFDASPLKIIMGCEKDSQQELSAPPMGVG
jgi:hypothetical protein